MDFTAFDTTEDCKDYAAPGQAGSGAPRRSTKSLSEKTANVTDEKSRFPSMGGQLMEIIAAFGKMQSMDPVQAPAVQAQVKTAARILSREHYYTCSNNRFWASSASCTPQAVRLPKTSTPQVAPVPPGLPARRSRCIAGRQNKAVQVTQ